MHGTRQLYTLYPQEAASYDAAAGCRCSAYPATPISEVRGRKPLHVLCQHAHRPFHLRRTQARPVPVCLHPSIIVSRVHAPAARCCFGFLVYWSFRFIPHLPTALQFLSSQSHRISDKTAAELRRFQTQMCHHLAFRYPRLLSRSARLSVRIVPTSVSFAFRIFTRSS